MCPRIRTISKQDLCKGILICKYYTVTIYEEQEYPESRLVLSSLFLVSSDIRSFFNENTTQ